MVTEDRSRGQVILIGAIALAFIILGVVVVFNGVLYTETLSSGSTSQSANTAEKTELEIKQGLGCMLEQDYEEINDDTVSQFNSSYQNTTANSSPAVVDIKPDTDDSVTVTYDSSDTTYTQTLEIAESDCPEGGSE